MKREEVKALYLDEFEYALGDEYPHDVYALVDKIFDHFEAEIEQLKAQLQEEKAIAQALAMRTDDEAQLQQQGKDLEEAIDKAAELAVKVFEDENGLQLPKGGADGKEVQ